MNPHTSSQKVEVWMVLEAGPARYGPQFYPSSHPYAGQRRVGTIKVIRMTQKKPSTDAGQIAFKAEIDVDEGWFLDMGGPVIQAQVPAPPPPVPAKAKVDMPVRHRQPSQATQVLRKDP